MASTALFAALAGVGCSGGASASRASTSVEKSALARNTAPNVPSAEQSALEAANESFAFQVYGALGASPSANLVLSPYSLSSALGMTYAGARTATADQMAQALDFIQLDPSTATSQAEVPPAFDWLDLQLASRAGGAVGDAAMPFALHVANSVWGQKGDSFEEPFLDTLATDYGAGIELANFSGDPDGSRQMINAWASDETDGKIAELIPAGGIDMSTQMVLVNAVYFDAQWNSTFPPGETSPGTFTRLDGSTVQPSMMQQASTFAYASSAGFQLVEMPYQGQEVAMDVVLPAAGTSPATVTAAVFNSLVGALQTQVVAVTMPKFQTDGGSIDVAGTLSQLGMSDAFNQSTADFSGISTSDMLYIGHVFHQAFVEVDEEGTVAAAATAVGFEDAAAIMPNATVTVDHPFFFVIRDVPTNTILFLGEIVDPTA
jgi:serine protease inhibitor